jgi:hypothetical protein
VRGRSSGGAKTSAHLRCAAVLRILLPCRILSLICFTVERSVPGPWRNRLRTFDEFDESARERRNSGTDYHEAWCASFHLPAHGIYTLKGIPRSVTKDLRVTNAAQSESMGVQMVDLRIFLSKRSKHKTHSRKPQRMCRERKARQPLQSTYQFTFITSLRLYLSISRNRSLT